MVFSDPTGLDSEYNWSNNYGSHGRFFQTGHYNFRDNNYLAINAGNSGAGGGGGGTTPKFETAQELSDYLMKITPAGRNRSYADMGNGQWAQFVWESYVYNPNEPGNAIDNRGGTLNGIGFGMRKVFIGHPVASVSVGRGNGGGASFPISNEFSATLAFGSWMYADLGDMVANKRGWIDARGNYRSTNLLKQQANGKFVRGVQGYNNGYKSALNAASKYKVAGNVVGVLSLGVTYYQYESGQISGYEASVDTIFGVVGFFGPVGAAISATYFIGKMSYEYFSGNTLFTKPQ